jgi:hypothetical protein
MSPSQAHAGTCGIDGIPDLDKQSFSNAACPGMLMHAPCRMSIKTQHQWIIPADATLICVHDPISTRFLARLNTAGILSNFHQLAIS